MRWILKNNLRYLIADEFKAYLIVENDKSTLDLLLKDKETNEEIKIKAIKKVFVEDEFMVIYVGTEFYSVPTYIIDNLKNTIRG